MSVGKLILLGFLLLPLAEIAVFVAVASHIGFLPAFALCIATSLVGFALLGSAGRGRIAHFRVAMVDGEVRALEGMPGLFTVLAGLLLVLPGFISDAIGLALLVPALQRRLSAAIGRAARRGPGRDGVVDLDPDEWRRVDQRDGEPARRPRIRD